MYKLERKAFGYQVTFSGEVTIAEMEQIKMELAELLMTIIPPFSVLADIRETIPFKDEIKKMIGECQKMEKDASIQRRAVVLQSPVVMSQVKQMSFQTRTDDVERQINAFFTDDWEKIALDWIIDGIEPKSPLDKEILAKRVN